VSPDSEERGMTKTSEAKVVTTIRIDGDEAQRLREFAKEEDRSVSSVIRLAVRQYLRYRDGD
jgi:predicted transcriptional regulator